MQVVAESFQRQKLQHYVHVLGLGEKICLESEELHSTIIVEVNLKKSTSPH